MNQYTSIALVLLRLAIGWHFLFEGFHKLHSLNTPKPFSSEIYFRESAGPLGKTMRSYLADPDQSLLTQLNENSLAGEMDNYYSRIKESMDLTPEQGKQVEAALEKQKAKTLEWFKSGKKEIEFSSPDGLAAGTLKTEYTIPKWVEYYREKLAEVEKVRGENRGWALGKDLDKARLAALKSEIVKTRRVLQEELETQKSALANEIQKNLTADQKNKAITEKAKNPGPIYWIDRMTIWGITAIGAGLFLGAFTRLAAWGGIVFLAMTYFTVPPFPWLPVPPINEGNYVFINKNVVEMLAMAVIATTNTGKIVGLDGLIAHFFPCCGKPTNPPP